MDDERNNAHIISFKSRVRYLLRTFCIYTHTFNWSSGKASKQSTLVYFLIPRPYFAPFSFHYPSFFLFFILLCESWMKKWRLFWYSLKISNPFPYILFPSLEELYNVRALLISFYLQLIEIQYLRDNFDSTQEFFVVSFFFYFYIQSFSLTATSL